MSKPLFVRIKRQSTSCFVASCNQLPGCMSEGRTYLEAIANFGAAVQAWAVAEAEKRKEACA